MLSCDDGNNVNGDGCSFRCTVENYYQCYNGSATSSSQCVYEGPIKIALLSTAFQTGSIAQFTFAMTPPINSLSLVKLNALFSVQMLPTFANVSWAYSEGSIVLSFTYSEGIEGANISFIFDFNHSYISHASIPLNTTVKSQGIELLVYQFGHYL